MFIRIKEKRIRVSEISEYIFKETTSNWFFSIKMKDGTTHDYYDYFEEAAGIVDILDNDEGE